MPMAEKSHRAKWWGTLFLMGLIATCILYLFVREKPDPQITNDPPTASRSSPPPAPVTLPGDALLAGYADPSSPAMDDLRKIQRVAAGYFSVIKDASRYPIGGNADLAAALRGENANREAFLRADHPVFAKDGTLTDRWGSPLIVHPEGWKQLELRSAGPDRIPYNSDDLVLSPQGMERSNPR